MEEIRTMKPVEEIEMIGHSAECRYCKGIVKMIRDFETLILRPDRCRCLLCGQRYYVKVKGSIDDWELEQWIQKNEL